MKSVKTEPLKDKKRIKKLFIIVAMAVLFLVCGATLVNQNADISRMEQKKVQLSSQLETQNEENEKLKEIVNSDNKDEYIEQKAREKGYVKDGEVVFYDISGTE